MLLISFVMFSRFTRSPNFYSEKMTSVELTFTNQSDQPITNIKVGEKVNTTPNLVIVT